MQVEIKAHIIEHLMREMQSPYEYYSLYKGYLQTLHAADRHAIKDIELAQFSYKMYGLYLKGLFTLVDTVSFDMTEVEFLYKLGLQ